MSNNHTIFINSTESITELCRIGGETNTDKSPLAYYSVCDGHRKGYTAVYSLLFSPYKNKECTFAEIGIEAGASIQMWNRYFSNKCTLYGFEFDETKIDTCKSMNLPNVIYKQTDVSNLTCLDETFKNTNVLFDIIIDDSSHVLEHQNNILQIAANYLKPGGILIIEDIQRSSGIDDFRINTDTWSFYTFLICHHDNRYCCDNDKLLYLIKS